MAEAAKIYLAISGVDYEGFTVVGVYDNPADALIKVNDTGHQHYQDYVEIQVFALNGERLEDDPAELYRETR